MYEKPLPSSPIRSSSGMNSPSMKIEFEVDGFAAHLGNPPHVDLGAIEVGVEDRDAVGGALTVFIFGRAGQQHDLVGDLRGRGPDLLPAHDISALRLLGESLDARRVEAGVGFGEAEGALILTGNQTRDPTSLLLVRSLHHDRMRAKKVDVDGRRGCHGAAVTGDLIHHDRRLRDAEPGAAVFFRHRDAEPTAIRHRAMELVREFPVLVALEPVVVIEASHDRADAFADRVALILGRQGFEFAHFEFAPE